MFFDSYSHQNAPVKPTKEERTECSELSKKLNDVEFANPFELINFITNSEDAQRHIELTKKIALYDKFIFQIERQMILN